MNNKITALITTYKRPHFLHRAIKSVLRQTYTNLQVCVFDDVSSDDTEKVVTDLALKDSRVNYFCHKSNIGSQKNFEYAFNSVSTPYFSVLSDDDFLDKDFYENAIQLLDDHPEIMFIIMDTILVDDATNLLGVRRLSTNKLRLFLEDDRFDAFHRGEFPDTWTAMVFRKEVAQLYKQEIFDEAGDMRFLLRAIARYPCAYLSKVAAYFTFHNGSFSLSRKNFDSIHQGIEALRYIEIVRDDCVSRTIKDSATFYLNQLLFSKPWYGLLSGFKRAIKNICNSKDRNIILAINDIQDAKNAGYTYTSFFLRFIYTNKFINKIIYLFFNAYYLNRSIRHNKKMNTLQNGLYRKYFENLKEIS